MNDVGLLIERFLAGVATAEEHEQLDRLLATDPRAAELLACHARLDALLRSHFRTERRVEEVVLAERGRAGAKGTDGTTPSTAVRRVRRWLVLAAALSVAVAATALVTLRWGHDEPVAAAGQLLSGRIEIAGKPADSEGMLLPNDKPIVVAAGAPALIRLADGLHAELEPGTHAVLRGPSDGIRQAIELTRGGGTFVVERAARGEFQVRTPAGRVTVLGTQFSVNVLFPPGTGETKMRAKSMVLVAVISGLVQVDVGGVVHRLTGGDSYVFGEEGEKRPMARGVVEMIDAGKITLAGRKKEGQVVTPAKTYTLAPDAKVAIGGQAKTRADVHVGAQVQLALADDQQTVTAMMLLAPLAVLHAADAPPLPTSMEIWLQGFPKGASNEAEAPREAWTLYFDDVRLTQAIDAEGGKSTILIGPEAANGDFESDGHALNSYLVRQVKTVEATDALPAASGKRFVGMVADPNARRHFPRAIKYLGMPDLNRGRYFVLTAKARAKETEGMVGASVSVSFRADSREEVKAYHGSRVAVTPDGWVEVRLEFDYDRGIPEAVGARERLAGLDAERAKYPPYDITPRPDDGKNLALSVAKWEGRAGIPGEPFRVWIVGASWAGALAGQSHWLEKAIRERFPNTPPIAFKSHSGSGCPWNYARGWVSQFVLADSPDLILIYTHGDLPMLDVMLADIRRHSTADVIIPSHHLMGHEDQDPRRWLDWFQAGHGFSVIEQEKLAEKHGVEFVRNRHELADYLTGIGKTPKALLGDSAHQNGHGILRTWDNIVRHIAKPAAFSYAPESRERRVPVSPATETATESVALTGGWKMQDGVARTGAKGERIKVTFTGNRIDLLGRSLAGGGKVRVLIDGQPADAAPVFFTTPIKNEPIAFPWKIPGPGPGDVGPHAVTLGENIVPQTWTITLTSETGDYRLDGSETGPDGEGNSTKLFTSRSGQIRIDPLLWRYNREGQEGDYRYGNRTGDKYSFAVYRCAVGQVSFAAAGTAPLHQPLVQNLPNGEHTLEIVSQGDGDVVIESFYVFQPPEK
jgi:hypothetical protein